MLNNGSHANSRQGQKLGVLHLGTVLSKHKFTLVEEDDIDFVRDLTLEGQVIVDRNGNGIKIFATVTGGNTGRSSLFHIQLWEHHYGTLPLGCTVIHKNGITMDNRLSNLEMISLDPKTGEPVVFEPSEEEAEERQRSAEIYKTSLQQFSARNPLRQQTANDSQLLVDANGDLITSLSEPEFFECHNLSCSNTETRPGQFMTCSDCHVARYCCEECKEQDSQHADDCDDLAATAAAATAAATATRTPAWLVPPPRARTGAGQPVISSSSFESRSLVDAAR